jgi:ribose-phosphate pyrophosphokinase
MNNERCILFSGNASKSLAVNITNRSDQIQYGTIEHTQFPSGEWHCQFQDNIRGADVILLQSTHKPANDNFMQLLVMADAARRASAGRITAVVPYLGYSRQDRKDESRVPISAKLVMDLMTASGINRFVTMDLHAAQLQGFTNSPFDHLYFQPLLMNATKDLPIDVICSPDIGGIKKAVEFSIKTDKDFAFIVKKRKNATTVEVTQFVGDVKDKGVLIIDDLSESAGTLVAAARECRDNGAKYVVCAVTHPCLTSVGWSRLSSACKIGIINHFYCSDTVIEDFTFFKSDWTTVVPVGGLFHDAITAIHKNLSISSLFQYKTK